jgi:hypothetical protein
LDAKLRGAVVGGVRESTDKFISLLRRSVKLRGESTIIPIVDGSAALLVKNKRLSSITNPLTFIPHIFTRSIATDSAIVTFTEVMLAAILLVG